MSSKCMVCLALVLMVLVLAEAFPGEKSKFDNMDADAICKNKRLLKSYNKCILGLGSCTAEGRSLKESIPKALETKCSSCSEADKEKVKKGVNCVRCSYPDDWKAIMELFDPNNEHHDYIVELFGEESC